MPPRFVPSWRLTTEVVGGDSAWCGHRAQLSRDTVDMAMNTSAQDRSGRPRWTLSEAARRTGVSRATLLRRIESGKIPGATKTEDGWSIGVEDLLAAGFHPDRPTMPAPVHEHAHMVVQPPTDTARRIAALEQELAVAHAQRVAAEQVAAERERIIQAQALTLRMLEAAPMATEQRPSASSAQAAVAGHSIDGSRHEPDSALTWLRRRILG